MRSLVCGLGILLVLGVAAFMLHDRSNSAVGAFQAAENEAEGDILLADIGTLSYGGNTYRVRPALDNRLRDPQLWNFAVEPLLQPVRLDTAANPVDVKIVPFGGKFLVTFNVELWNKTAEDKAFAVVNRSYPVDGFKVKRDGIRAIRIKSITPSCDDLRLVDPAATIEPATFEIPRSGGMPDQIPIRILTDTQEHASGIAALLQFSSWDFSLKLSEQIALQARAQITASANLKAGFRNRLQGQGGAGYMHRSDFREYLETNRGDIEAHVIVDKGAIADPDAFFERVLRSFTTRWDTLEARSYKQLDATALKATYNAKDLAPEEVTKELSRRISKDGGTNTFKVSKSSSGGGGFSLGPISVNGKGQSGYTKDQIQQWLRENDVSAEWNGTRWIAKDVNVRQVNATHITSLFQTVFTQTLVLPSKLTTDQVTLSFGQATQESAQALGARIRQLEQTLESYVPIGTVCADAGSTAQAKTRFLPAQHHQWLLCDGRALLRTEYPELFAVIGTAHGDGGDPDRFHLPDYRGRFLRGDAAGTKNRDFGPREISASGGAASGVGSYQKDSTRLPRSKDFLTNHGGHHGHTINIEHTASRNPNGGQRNTVASPDTDSNHPKTSQNGNHNHTVVDGGDQETRPTNIAVNFMIRVR